MKPSPLSKPLEPKISTANIQEPYSDGAVLGSQVKPSPMSKPSEPKISTSNIQEPYGDGAVLGSDASSRPHPVDQDPDIERTNVALDGLKNAPKDPQPLSNASDSGAPTPPPKPENEADLVGKKTAYDVNKLNTSPTHGHYKTDEGLNAPDSKLNTGVGGGNANISGESLEGSESSGSGQEETPKKKKGSRIIQKVKEKFHMNH